VPQFDIVCMAHLLATCGGLLSAEVSKRGDVWVSDTRFNESVQALEANQMR
jgi:hypothetical protein